MEVIEGISGSDYEFDINPKKVCRLCLSQPPNLQNIFSNSIVDGYIISIPDMLAFTVDITVATDDKLPSKICIDCKKQIVTFYTFKQKTKRTEQSLISMFSSDTNTVQDVHVIPDSIQCSFCYATFDTENAFIQHAQQDHQDIDIFEMDDTSEKMIKSYSKGQEIEFYDFDAIGNAENSSETEITAEGIQIEETDVLTAEEEQFVAPARLERSRASSSKTTKYEPSKVNRPRQTEKTSTSTSKMVFKTEVNDFDENIDINDDYEQTGSESLDLYEFQCEGCNKLYDDEEQLLQHDCEANDVNDEDLICVPCNKKMKSTAQLRQHNKMHDSMSLIITYLDFFPCHDCCLLFLNKERLNKHNKYSHPEKNAKSLVGLSEKIDESCTDYQFLDEEKQLDFKEGEVYSCGECSQSFQTINELKVHVISHASKYECPIEECGCQYDQLSRLSIHVLNKHINTKNLQCLHCSKAFKTYDDLQSHQRLYCKEKKFKCNECDKKFFSRKALITHLRTLKEKKFKCKLCGKTFKQMGELTIHTRSHTNERPFKCTICNKSYKTSSMRAAHMDSHISGKTFECTQCDKKLQSRTSYRNHMKRHTEEKKHECLNCGKKFFTRYHLRLHQSKIHKGVVSEDTNGGGLTQLIDDDSTMIVFE
ncbi:zinc finger protein 502-like [Contarinia nasturtii]|uniref:zinc finger protein 502-like n=1 Tax=Contarinia nasturtii TaxID=265458 RepID=UPI0012D3F5CA|nr:zinc finger protein 502-like [Contarinia nasturtii]